MAKSKEAAKPEEVDKSGDSGAAPRASGIATRASAIVAGATALTLGLGFAAGYAVGDSNDEPYGPRAGHAPIAAFDGTRGPGGPGQQGNGPGQGQHQRPQQGPGQGQQQGPGQGQQQGPGQGHFEGGPQGPGPGMWGQG